MDINNQIQGLPAQAPQEKIKFKIFLGLTKFGIIFGGILGAISTFILTSCAGFGLYAWELLHPHICTPMLYLLNPWLMILVWIPEFGSISTPFRFISTILSVGHFGPIDRIGNPILFVVINLLLWSLISRFYVRFNLIGRIILILIVSAVIFIPFLLIFRRLYLAI